MFTVQGTCALSSPTNPANTSSNPVCMILTSPSGRNRYDQSNRCNRSATPGPGTSLRAAVVRGLLRARMNLKPAADPSIVQPTRAKRRPATRQFVTVHAWGFIRLAALLVVHHSPGHAVIAALHPAVVAPTHAIVAVGPPTAGIIRAARHPGIPALGGPGIRHVRHDARERGQRCPPGHGAGERIEPLTVHQPRPGRGRLPTASKRTLTRSRQPHP